VETGFRKRSCSNKKLEPVTDSTKNHKALAAHEISKTNSETAIAKRILLLLNVPAQSMNVSGEFTVKAPRDVVFDTLRDARSFVRFVDGVQDLKEIDSTHKEMEKIFATRLREAFAEKVG
jgi:hypothetical protein